jgi:AsmA protein
MRNTTKTLLTGFLLLLLTLVIAVCSLAVLIEPNDYKAQIAAFIKDKTACDVMFEGDLKLSLFPWIGIRAEKIIVNDKQQQAQGAPLIRVEASDIKVKLLPLITKTIEIDSIVLDGITLNLSKNKQGIGNWEGLIAANVLPQPNAADSKPIKAIVKKQNSLAALSIAGITLKNAQVNWNNQQTGKHLQFSNIAFSTEKFAFGKPTKINTSMEISGEDSKFSGSVKYSTHFSLDENLNHLILNDSNLAWNSLAKTALKQSSTATIILPSTDISIGQQTLKLNGLILQSGDIKLTADINGEHMIDNPCLLGTVAISPFNPRANLKQWNVEIPTTSDPNALTNLGMAFNFQANAEQAEFTNLNTHLDNSHGTGTFTVKNYSQPSIFFDFTVDTLDADRYLPPQDSPSMASPGISMAVGAINLSLDWLKKLDADGKLAVGKMKLIRMTIQDVHLTLSSKKGLVKIGQTASQVYQGTYSSNLNMDARAETLSLALNEKLTNIQLEPLLKDIKGKAKMGGIVTASTQLHSQGINTHEHQSTLTGQLSFFLKDGFIKGFNLEKMLENSAPPVKGSVLLTDAQHDQTQFSEIRGTGIISKGLLQNNDLIANTAKLRSAGKGNANLNSGQLDYTITTKLLKAAATATTLEQVHDTPIVVHLSGTFSKPIFSLDVAALLTDKNKAKVERLLDNNKDKINKLLNKLDKKLGPGASDLLKKIF